MLEKSGNKGVTERLVVNGVLCRSTWKVPKCSVPLNNVREYIRGTIDRQVH